MAEIGSSGWLWRNTRLQAIKQSPSICILVILGLVLFIYHQFMEEKAFPSASINLKYSRSQIVVLAHDWSAKLGYMPPKPISSVEFNCDDNAKVFLERQFGQVAANQLMRDTLPVWCWQCRFMRQYEQESTLLQFSPTGQLYHFTRTLENDRHIPSVDRQRARQIAQNFVETEVKIPLAKWELIDSEDTTQVARTDHSFQWQENADYRGAHRRISVTICGDSIGSYDLSLHTPESWQRDYETLRSYNSLLGGLAAFVFGILCLYTLYIFATGIAVKSLDVRTSIIIGALFAGGMIANTLNSIPSWTSGYSTQEAFQSFILRTVSSAAFGSLASFAAIGILASAVQIAYRRLFPGKLALKYYFNSKVLRSRQLIEGIIVGYAACGIAQGYQIAYYVLGKKIGIWCPLSTDNYQIISDAFPFISAMAIGIFAAIMEEGLYRIVALGLFTRLCKNNFWAANLLQAAAWAFMHSDYPQQPAYARGLELTIDGLFAGWILKRYGLPACLISHYLFDAYSSVELLHSAPAALALTAYIPLLLPAILLAACLLLIYKHGYADDSELANVTAELESKSVPVSPLSPELPSALNFIYSPLKQSTRIILAAFCLLTIIALMFIHSPLIGAETKPLSVTREQAIQIARQYFIEKGINVDGYLVSAYLYSGFSNGQSNIYLQEKLGADKTRALLTEIENPLKWHVRFCKPLVPDEYSIHVAEDGAILAPEIFRLEDAPGAKLPVPDARNIADSFLKRYRALYTPFIFQDMQKTIRKNRIDYTFTYLVPKFKVADADFKITINVIGDQPSAVSHYWQLPDNWQWAFDKRSHWDTISEQAHTILLVALAIATFWFIISILRNVGAGIRWKQCLILGGTFAIVQLLKYLNALPGFFTAYTTTTPFDSFIMQSCIREAGSTATISAFFAFATLIAIGTLQRYFPEYNLKQSLQLAFCRQEGELKTVQNGMWLDGILIAAAFCLSGSGVAQISAFLAHSFAHRPPFEQLPGWLAAEDSLWAPGSAILSSLSSTLSFILLMILLSGFYRQFIRNRKWLLYLCLALLIVYSNMETKFWQDYMLSAAQSAISIALIYTFIFRNWQKNFLILLFCSWFGLVNLLMSIYRHAMPLYAVDFSVLMLIIIAPLGYLFYLQLARAPIHSPAAVIAPASK